MVISKAHCYERKWYYVNKHDVDQEIFEGKKLSAAWIKQWLLILFMINMSAWVCNSFFELKRELGSSYPLAYEMFGIKSMIWFMVAKVCVPVTMFYRIHAAAMIIYIWFEFN